jgi:uncharacterized protein (DUF1684 family)
MAAAQDENYADTLLRFREKYIEEHEVIKDNDRSQLRFFAVNQLFCVPARLERIEEAPWFKMETSGTVKKIFRVYGILHFTISDTSLKLNIYQSRSLMTDPQYADYLLIPFTDKTSGEESYDNGRYIDLSITELESPGFMLDFNKAYNPYCAYITGKYNCPVPPKENDLKVAIRAGEMRFGKGY